MKIVKELKNKMGEIKKSNSCGLMKIIEYNKYSDIKVKFKTGSVVKTNYSSFKNGGVKDPLFPSMYGIGYVGIGKYKTSINSKITIEYNTWKHMLGRCYDPKYINKKLTYQTAIVCKEWHNFQTFAEWFSKNYYKLFDVDIQLDKDIIKKGNKIYCPEYCSFVPRSINMLLVKSDKARGEYPIGVYFDKYRNKYVSRVTINGKIKYLGRSFTPEEAFNIYKVWKEKYIKIMTNKYKDILNIKVYNSLMKYQVLITD